MEDVKFRAWDVDGKCWIPQPLLAVSALDGNKDILTYDEDEDRWIAETVPFALMLFTGIKDSQGNEIYEGDIIQQYKWNDNLYIILWNKERCGFWLYTDLSNPHLELATYRDNLEVVGNICENHELLTKEA